MLLVTRLLKMFMALSLQFIVLGCANSSPPELTIYNSNGEIINSVMSAFCWDKKCEDNELKNDDLISGDFVKTSPKEQLEIVISDIDKYPLKVLTVHNWFDNVEFQEQPEEIVLNRNKFVLPQEAGKYIFSVHAHWEIGGDMVKWFFVEIEEDRNK